MRSFGIFLRNSVSFALLLGVLGGACHRREAPRSDALSMAINSEPVTLDPSRAEDGLALRILCNLMDGLVGYSNAGKLEMRLAQSVEKSRDQKTYTFTLRPDARWSDGQPVTPQDFITAIERARKPETGSRLGSLYHVIESMRAEGPRLIIQLKRPFSAFVDSLTLPIAMPQRADVLAKTNGRWDPLSFTDLPVTGPYRITSHRRDQEIRLETWQTLPPGAPRQVVLKIVQDESTALQLFEQGGLDLLGRIPAYDQKRLMESGKLKTAPFLATYFLSFNLKKPPFNQREWRRAVAGAIHRKQIEDAIASGDRAAGSWIPEGLEGYQSFAPDPMGRDPRFQDSVARVRHALAQGKAPQEVELGFDGGGRNALVMEKVQSDLKKELGLNVKLRSMDWKTHLKTLHTDPLPIFRFGWFAPFLDPILYLTPFVTGDFFNFTKWSNARYDALVEKIKELPPGPEREKTILAAQNILVVDEAIVVPIYHYVSAMLVSDRVQNFVHSPFGITRFSELRVQ